jgi:dTDP-L-rhamnose 4-epimerase
MRVLVTGGAGFIGSHLVDRLLSDGCDVRVLDVLDPQVHSGVPGYLSRDAELIVGDVCDADVVRRALEGVDRLVHLAAAVGVGQSMYEIARYTHVNAMGAAVVLEQSIDVRERLEKIVVASSMSVYGEGLYRCVADGAERAPDPRPEQQLRDHAWELTCPDCGETLEPVSTPESKPLQPQSIYAIGKRDHEEMFLVFGAAYGVPVTALRFFNVYGTRQSLSNPYTGVAAIFSSRLLNGRAPIVFEDGLQSRDFVHVSDVVDAVVRSLAPGRGDGAAVNVGSGSPITIRALAALLAKELAVAVEPEVRNTFRAGDIRHCVADIARARDLLAYEPRVGLEQGMRELVAWLGEQEAADHVEQAAADLAERGLTKG